MFQITSRAEVFEIISLFIAFVEIFQTVLLWPVVSVGLPLRCFTHDVSPIVPLDSSIVRSAQVRCLVVK